MFFADRLASRQPEIEDEQSHGDGKDSVAQSGETFHALARDPIVGGSHGACVYQGEGV